MGWLRAPGPKSKWEGYLDFEGGGSLVHIDAIGARDLELQTIT